MNRRAFLQSLFAAGVSVYLPKVSSAPLSIDEVLQAEADGFGGDLEYRFLMGLPIVTEAGERFRGKMPKNARFTMDGGIKVGENIQAAWRLRA